MDPVKPVVATPEVLSTPQNDNIPSPVPFSNIDPSKPKSNILLILSLILVFMVVAGFGYYVYSKKVESNSSSGLSSNSNLSNIKTPRYWINCNDISQVIEENNLLYVGCLGGVLVIDKETGKVADQLSMANGLGDIAANSIIKKGDNLYVGSQDGFTIFNLKTRVAQKISVKEGLVNGSNIKLTPDGDNIWVATFDGVSKFNTVTGELTNYTTDLDSASQKRNIVNTLVTDKYVYFLEVANAYSSGAVIRLNKTDNTIQTFKPDSFGRTDQYARLDPFTLAKFGNLVFFSDDKEMYSIDDSPNSTWKKIESPFQFILKDLATTFSTAKLLQNSDSKGILMTSGSKIYRYIPDTDTTEVFYDFGKEYANILASSVGDTLWYSQASDKNFISALNINTKQVRKFELKDRPKSINSAIALIDDEAILNADTSLVKYSPNEDKFTTLISGLNDFDSDFGVSYFQPIAGTSEIFLLFQSCGQWCETPKVSIYNYQDGSSKEIKFPSDIIPLITQKTYGGAVSYVYLPLSWRDSKNGKIGFSYGSENKYIVFDLNTKEWSKTDKIPDSADKYDPDSTTSCNRVYSFKTNGNKFSPDDCTGVATNGSLSWKDVDNKIIETDLKTNKTTELNLPALPPSYSPFDTVSDRAYGKMMYADGKLWVASDRGLTSYNPNDGSYKLYGPEQGLTGKNITSYVIGKYIWAVANWGGLSVIEK